MSSDTILMSTTPIRKRGKRNNRSKIKTIVQVKVTTKRKKQIEEILDNSQDSIAITITTKKESTCTRINQ
jgi:hypothetical protein